MSQKYIDIALMLVFFYAAWKYRDEIVAAVNQAVGGGFGGGGGGGPFSQEGSCPSGEQCKKDSQGRMDCDNANSDSYEATWCGSFSGDRMSIKLYGPPHSKDGDCCWCILYIEENGKFVVGGEGPHPHSNCDKKDGQSIGSTSNICVKAVMTPGPTLEGYALVNGKWQQMVSYRGPCGCDKTSNQRTGSHVEFRVDGNFNTTCATVRPLNSALLARKTKETNAFFARKRKLNRIGY